MKHNENQLIKALKGSDKPPVSRGKDAFWADFKARAATVPQDGAQPIPSPRILFQTWVRVAAAVLVLGVSGVLSVKMMNRSQAPEKVSNIQEVDVFMEYSSMVILEDVDHGGTFVWITEEESVDQG